MDITLEKAVVEDAEAFAAVQDQAFYEDYKEFGVCPGYGRSVESYRDSILKKPNYKVVVDGRIVGKISITKEGNKGHVDSLCVIPEYQSKGIGQQIIALVEKQHANITHWVLETPLARERNLHFYKRCGYEITGKMNDGIWLAILEKRIGEEAK